MEIKELEETLCRLPTVDAVRIIESGGDIAEIHVLAGAGKPPKQVVRDVQSLAMAAYGLTVDRRTVSVVQIEDEERGRSERPSIVEITENPAGSKLTIQVTLAWQNEMFTGETSGPLSSATRLRLVGDAALDALGKAIGDDGLGLAIASIDTPTIGNRQVANAVVVMVSGGEERLLVGCALVGQDEAQAAVRAVLDAMNRVAPQLRR